MGLFSVGRVTIANATLMYGVRGHPQVSFSPSRYAPRYCSCNLQHEVTNFLRQLSGTL